ncbi:MAG: aminotransferase class V-fold PLP-dependent enzyme [Cyclobacteriaceae bacterium]
MVCFYPGPAKIYPSVKQHLNEAYDSGLLERNHRSAPFEALLKETVSLLKEKLAVPSVYSISFVSSATECWEICTQSFTEEKSLHIYNGAFGKKWFDYAKRINASAERFVYDCHQSIIEKLPKTDADLICITHNETSNGTQVNSYDLKKVREVYSDQLIAVDATSSMAGVELPFEEADIWYASVQKCFGLPAGMAVLICSPKAVEQAKQIDDNRFYNSYNFIEKNFSKSQTTHTPNILGIYLLNKVMEEISPITKISQQLQKQAKEWAEVIQKSSFDFLIENESVRSDTVLAIKGKSLEQITDFIKQAEQNGFVIGKGYGEWKETTFRIANFPAISELETTSLQHFFESYG